MSRRSELIQRLLLASNASMFNTATLRKLAQETAEFLATERPEDIHVVHHLGPEVMNILRGIYRLEKIEMTKLEDIQAAQDKTTAEIQRQTTINAGVKTLLAANAQSLRDLAAQIEALKAGTVTDEQLASLAAQASANADALVTNDDDIAAAVTAGTPAETVNPT